MEDEIMDYNNNNYNGYGQQQYNNQYAQQDMNQNYQYQQNMQANPYQANAYQQAPKPQLNISQDIKFNQYGMRWFLFMLWGYLVYGIINNISTAITMFKASDATGIDEMKTLTIIAGLLYVGVAVLCYYTRKLMINFSVQAPKFIVASAAAPLAVIVVLIIGLCSALEAELDEVIELLGYLLTSGESWTVWVYIIIYAAFIYGNYVYFNNRRHIFNNTQKINLF